MPTLETIRSLVDRLWSGEVEIVTTYLRTGPTRESDIGWAKVQAWRAFLDANLWTDGMALARRFLPGESQQPAFILGGRDLYMKWRAHDIVASLLEDWTQEKVTGLDLCAEAAVADWGAGGRAVDALLAQVRATGHPEAEAVIRMIGETGLGMCFALSQDHADGPVREAATTLLHEACQRLSFHQRALAEAAGSGAAFSIVGAKGGGWAGETMGARMMGLEKKPYVNAEAVADHLLRWRLRLRNEQFERPLSPERLTAIGRETPAHTTASIAAAVRLAV